MTQENEIVEHTESISHIEANLQKELKVISFITVALAIAMLWLDSTLTFGQGTLSIAALLISAGCYRVACDTYNHKYVQYCTLLNFVTLLLCGIVILQFLFGIPYFDVQYNLNLFFSGIALMCWGGIIVVSQRRKD